MPGFLLFARANAFWVLIADHIRAVRGTHADEVTLVDCNGADAAVAPERGHALIERVEAAVLRAALVHRAVASGGGGGIRWGRELTAGNEGEAEGSGEGGEGAW
jgi:hypothetical protein